MTTKDVLKTALNSNHHILTSYLADLSDSDLLVRPTPGANHIAWQLGHLIVAEGQHFLPKIPGAKAPELPAGFAQQHSKETAGNDSPAGFRTKAEYLELFDKVRSATLDALAHISEADLDKETGIPFAPTVGVLLFMVGNHEMMHAGQFSVVRRKLGKPVLF